MNVIDSPTMFYNMSGEDILNTISKRDIDWLRVTIGDIGCKSYSDSYLYEILRMGKIFHILGATQLIGLSQRDKISMSTTLDKIKKLLDELTDQAISKETMTTNSV